MSMERIKQLNVKRCPIIQQ